MYKHVYKPTFDGTVCLIRGYADQATCEQLTAWAQSARRAQFVPGISRDRDGRIHRVTTRLTNRMSHYIQYPKLVYDLQRRIRDDFRLATAPWIHGHGRDGVVVSITDDGGDVYAHRDPPVARGFSALRCNILASQAESGGLVHVANGTYELAAGDLMAYLVTDHTHSVDQCFGSLPRIMFMFGFEVLAEDWVAARHVPDLSVNPSGAQSEAHCEPKATIQDFQQARKKPSHAEEVSS